MDVMTLSNGALRISNTDLRQNAAFRLNPAKGIQLGTRFTRE